MKTEMIMPVELWGRAGLAAPLAEEPDLSGRAGLSRTQNDLIDAGDLEGAERLLRTRLAENPREESHVTRLELARILFWRGQLQQSRELLEWLREEHPGDTWIASFLGQVAVRFGDYERARALFQEALALDGANHEAHLFLGGDDLGDALRARRMLTHRILSPRGRIELAAIFAAIDFRRGRQVSLAHGELTQACLDRANLLMDLAQVGDDVDAAVSLRPALLSAQRIVFYTSHALGDTLLGLSAVDAFFRFFRLHPEMRRPLEIVSPYASVLEGIAEQYPQVTVRCLCGARDPAEGAIYADDLRGRQERVLALVGSAPSVTAALLDVAREYGHVQEVVDLLIDRYSRDLVPWQSLLPPYSHINSYPAKLHRLVEILLGCKLAGNPAEVSVTLPLAHALRRHRELLLRRHRLAGASYHCVVESASKRSKAFAPALLGRFLAELARECAQVEQRTGQPQRILFSCDVDCEDSFAREIADFPEPLRARIETVHEDLPALLALLSSAETVVSTDTGIAHLASALGRQTAIVFTVADPFLWSTGGSNVRALWTPQALSAHTNLTPVNMQQWEVPHPIMEDSLTVRDLMDVWRRCHEAATGFSEQSTRYAFLPGRA